jgi:hypothetical protein
MSSQLYSSISCSKVSFALREKLSYLLLNIPMPNEIMTIKTKTNPMDTEKIRE